MRRFVLAATMLGFFVAGRYERNKIMVAGEYSRPAPQVFYLFPQMPKISSKVDERLFYVMASDKFAPRLTGGLYYSSATNRRSDISSGRYQKDWALTARYDFNSYRYAKLEEHIMDGTLISYSTSNNPAGFRPDTHSASSKSA